MQELPGPQGEALARLLQGHCALQDVVVVGERGVGAISPGQPRRTGGASACPGANTTDWGAGSLGGCSCWGADLATWRAWDSHVGWRPPWAGLLRLEVQERWVAFLTSIVTLPPEIL